MRYANQLLASFWRESMRRAKTGLALAWIATHPRAARRIRAEKAWLFGCAAGQMYGDNSAALHQYIVRHHPEISAYWVIDHNSADVNEARAFGSVLFHGEVRTYVHSLLAAVHVISHGIHDIPGSISTRCKAFRVRVGHGITATRIRRPSRLKSLESANQRYDLYPVSSDFEKANKKTWGAPDAKIVITGIPRFDTLLKRQAEHRAEPKTLLYMPTWRDGSGAGTSRTAEYTEGILAFLSHDKLHDALERNDAMLEVVFHMLARQHLGGVMEKIASSRIRFVRTSDPQQLFVKVSAAITDYSSITWDLLYLDKPVFFYQFDRSRFDVDRRSYMGGAQEWPGPVFECPSELIDSIDDYFLTGKAGDGVIAEKVEHWKKRVFAYRDGNNCQRVATEIMRRLEGP